MSYQEAESLFYERSSEGQADGEPGLAVGEIRFEYQREALGLGVPRPRVSWWMKHAPPRWRQAAYEMEVYDTTGHLYGQTGRVSSAESVLVPWPFAALRSREALLIRLRVWDMDGAVSPWS